MKNINVCNNTLFLAFKYALGRKSSAPSIVMTDIIKNKEKIEDIYLKKYIEEIDNCTDFGLEKDNWLRLRDDLQIELEYRKTLMDPIKLVK
jgi:hypothetical protein